MRLPQFCHFWKHFLPQSLACCIYRCLLMTQKLKKAQFCLLFVQTRMHIQICSNNYFIFCFLIYLLLDHPFSFCLYILAFPFILYFCRSMTFLFFALFFLFFFLFFSLLFCWVLLSINLFQWATDLKMVFAFLQSLPASSKFFLISSQ